MREARPRLAEGHRRVPAAAAEGEPGARRRGGGEQRPGAGRQKVGVEPPGLGVGRQPTSVCLLSSAPICLSSVPMRLPSARPVNRGGFLRSVAFNRGFPPALRVPANRNCNEVELKEVQKCRALGLTGREGARSVCQRGEVQQRTGFVCLRSFGGRL